MRGVALCAGSGGLELGIAIAEPAYRCVCYVEGEARNAATLIRRMGERRLGEAPIWSDVRTFDGKPWRGVVDIVSGGYPCQPFSLAGKRRGESDHRHLWPSIARIIGEMGPEWCFFENVPGHLSLGFEEVANDLGRLGYKVAVGLFTAEEVGAPQIRERLFILAHAERDGWEGGEPAAGQAPNVRRRFAEPRGALANASDSGRGWEGPGSRLGRRVAFARASRGVSGSTVGDSQGVGFGQGPELAVHAGQLAAPFTSRLLPLFPPGPGDLDAWREVLAYRPELEPAVCRVADGVADRVDRLRSVGNGVVPLEAAYALGVLRDALRI